MIGVAYKGAAFPVIWEVLSWEKGQNKGKAGGSSTAERKELFERFLRLVPAEKIQAFVADREFISAEGLGLSGRARRSVRHSHSLQPQGGARSGPKGGGGGAHVLSGLGAWGRRAKASGSALRQRFVGEEQVTVMGKRLNKEDDEFEDDEFLILIASPGVDSDEVPELYRRRWEIETLFAGMKSRGFDLEETHTGRAQSHR